MLETLAQRMRGRIPSPYLSLQPSIVAGYSAGSQADSTLVPLSSVRSSAQHTAAGSVPAAFMERYGSKPFEKIVSSWYAMHAENSDVLPSESVAVAVMPAPATSPPKKPLDSM